MIFHHTILESKWFARDVKLNLKSFNALFTKRMHLNPFFLTMSAQVVPILYAVILILLNLKCLIKALINSKMPIS